MILSSKKRYHRGTTSKITLDPDKDKDKDKDHLGQFLSKGRIHLLEVVIVQVILCTET